MGKYRRDLGIGFLSIASSQGYLEREIGDYQELRSLFMCPSGWLSFLFYCLAVSYTRSLFYSRCRYKSVTDPLLCTQYRSCKARVSAANHETPFLFINYV